MRISPQRLLKFLADWNGLMHSIATIDKGIPVEASGVEPMVRGGSSGREARQRTAACGCDPLIRLQPLLWL